MDLGITQAAAAATLGVSDTSLRHWEAGVCEPLVAQRPAIDAFLGDRPLEAAPRSLGEQLVRTRVARGYSRKALARALELDACTLARMESGSPYQPTARVLAVVRRWLVGTTVGVEPRAEEGS